MDFSTRSTSSEPYFGTTPRRATVQAYNMASVIDLDECSSGDTPSSSIMARSSSDSQEPVQEDQGEFYATLGPEWSYEKTRHTAVTADKVHFKRLLETEPRRPIEFVDGYLDSGVNTSLSKKHFYGALIYTRGDRVNKNPCRRCRTAKDAIFPECISMGSMASGACAADLWAGTQLECDNHKDAHRRNNKPTETISDDESDILPKPRRQSTRIAATSISEAVIEPNVSTRASWQKQLRESFSQASAAPVAKKGQFSLKNPFSTAANSSSNFDDSEDSDIVELIPKSSPVTNKVILSKKSKSHPVSLSANHATGSTKTTIRTKFPLLSSSPIPSRKRGRPRKREATEDRFDSPGEGRVSRRPRYEHPVREDLSWLQGNFDYQAAERCFEVTADDILEAKKVHRVQVGEFLLERFAVEMNAMWAVRIAAARWSNNL